MSPSLCAGELPRHEVDIRKSEGTLRLEPAAVRVDGGAGKPPGRVGAEPVLGTLPGTVLPAPGTTTSQL